ncbi:uncharacterized protein LOC116163385 [Photinus pyralis]|uniref:BEN domain-containing protein n=1 Tax=Photinus pyralis TaxID=7054 RepID=A0A1Y1NFK3_PHOPY|nr:uncharacterized protein LOC116163385 [Photinus pyralis]
MYAYVIFEEDNVPLVVSINDIKFKNSTYENYNSAKTYKVKYTDGHFYKAFIIAVAETMEEVKMKAEEKRIRLPAAKLRELNVANDEISSSDNENIPLNTMERNSTKKQKKSQERAYQLENYHKIMKSVSNQEMPMDLPNTMESKNWKEKYEELKKENKALTEEVQKLKELNINLQEEVIAKFKSIDFMQNPIPPMVTMDSQETSKPIPDDVPVAGLYDGQIHIGRGEWLPVAIFNMCMAKKKDSIFIKEIACSLFSPDVLSKSSVTGQPGNKTSNPAKPALDPTKLLAIEDILQFRMFQRGDTPDLKIIRNCVHKHVRDKIQDLIRPPRASKSKKLNSQSNPQHRLSPEEPQVVEEHVQDANMEIVVPNTFITENAVVLVDELGVEIGHI